MAPHHKLAQWQKILLGIFCFPLLPFYLCVYYLCLKNDKKNEDEERQQGHVEDAERVQENKTIQLSFSNKGLKHDQKIDGRNQQDISNVEDEQRGNKKLRFSFRNKGFIHDVPGDKQNKHSQDTGHVEDEQRENKKLKFSFRNEGFIHDVEGDKQRKHNQDIGHLVDEERVLGHKNINLSFRKKGFRNDFEENKQKERNEDIVRDVEDKTVYPKTKDEKYKPVTAFSYPWDRSNLKSLQIDLEAFKKLDAYASKLNTKGSLDFLMKNLLQDVRTDLEKIRAIWIWICYHIEYDTAGLQNKALRSTDPSDILSTRKGVCAGYSSLFEKMCNIAGVQCKTVSGFSKGAGYKIGQTFSGSSDHAWNMVYLEKGWHLLDSTWGAGHVDESMSNFSFKYNEFYFLTHPALFIEDHFPEHKESQLLVPHVSLKKFEQNARHKSQFYNLGLLSSQPDKGVIETENGKVSITIESRHPVLFTFHLNKNDKPGLIMLNEHGMKLDVYPQKTGQHVLNIFATNAGSEEEYPFIMEYRIDCKSVNTSMKIPKCLNNPVGPSWLSEKAGLLQPSHSEPVIHTKDGCCTISFVLEQDLKLFSTLYSEETELDRRYIFQRQTENKVEFKVRLPQSGTYVLCVNVKLKNSDSYMSQCNYIITCTNTAVKWPVFPLTYANWANNYELVEPLDGVLAENRNVTFKLHIPGVAAVSVKGKSSFPLTLSANGYWEGTCSTADIKEIYVMVRYPDQPNTWNYILHYQVKNK